MSSILKLQKHAGWRWTMGGLVMVLWLGLGCASSSTQERAETQGPHEEEMETFRSSDEDLPEIEICFDAPLPEGLEEQGFEGRGARMSSSMTPRHAASDTMTTPGLSVVLDAEFSYGPMIKDLEHQEVEIWIDDCGDEMRLLARGATDDDGEIHIALGANEVPDLGEYRLLFRLTGDGTKAESTLRVYPRGTKIVVFDIDGTLTTGHRTTVADFFADVGRVFGLSSYAPSLRPGAPEVTRKRVHDQGYVAVYITGRPFWMTERTRIWMQYYGFARGHMRTTSGWGEWFPSQGGVGEYKLDYLRVLRDRGFEIAAFYGNAETDRWAYQLAGGYPGEMFFVGGIEDDGLTHLGEGYLKHIQKLKKVQTRANQPFRYPSGME